MFDARIEIKKMSTVQDSHNETVDELVKVGTFYAQRTESGGRENLYASRIVHENEVVFTIRYTAKVEAGMFVIYGGQEMPITSVHDEGRRWRRHLKCLKSDANDTI